MPAVEKTTASTLTDRDRACFGPRDEKPPGSVAWCWQTLDLLKIRWQRKELTDRQFEETLQEIKDHEVWKVVPPEHPYGSLEALLSAKVGLDFFSQPDFFSQLAEAMRSLAVLHTSIPTLTPTDTGDAEVDMEHVVALCLAFKARCAEVEHALRQAFPALGAPGGLPPAPAPDEPVPVVPPEPDCPPYDTETNRLGTLCKKDGHEWGQTGQTLRNRGGGYCLECNKELKRRKVRQPAVKTAEGEV